MRIVITGAGGFVGRTLVRKLAPVHDVVALDTHLSVVAGVEQVIGDLGEAPTLARAFGSGCDAVIHLATMPGGAAESHPDEAKRVNIDAAMALIDAASAAGTAPRFVFASSIAVFGDPMPPHVDDATPIAPQMIYGAHKAMIETWVATQSRRGAIDGISLRLPGIVARPAGTSGMKSAFMSEIFHAALARRPFVAPVSPAATMWLMSVDRVATNLALALTCAANGRVITLPALRLRFGDLVAELARATGGDASLVAYRPEAALEAAFGNQPPLSTAFAERLGFADDGDLSALVASALSAIEGDSA